MFLGQLHITLVEVAQLMRCHLSKLPISEHLLTSSFVLNLYIIQYMCIMTYVMGISQAWMDRGFDTTSSFVLVSHMYEPDQQEPKPIQRTNESRCFAAGQHS